MRYQVCDTIVVKECFVYFGSQLQCLLYHRCQFLHCLGQKACSIIFVTHKGSFHAHLRSLYCPISFSNKLHTFFSSINSALVIFFKSFKLHKQVHLPPSTSELHILSVKRSTFKRLTSSNIFVFFQLSFSHQFSQTYLRISSSFITSRKLLTPLILPKHYLNSTLNLCCSYSFDDSYQNSFMQISSHT